MRGERSRRARRWAATAALAVVHAASAAAGLPPASEDPASVLGAFRDETGDLERRLDAMVAGADALAEAAVGGARFAVAGPAGVRLDFTNRPGAMLGYDGAPPRAGDAVLGVLPPVRDADLASHRARVGRLETYAAGGSTIVVVASAATLDAAGTRDRVDAAAAVVLDVDAPPSVDRAAVLAAAWAVHSELFAACTRLGETPVVQRCETLDRGHRRRLRYGDQRFHHDLWVDPVGPGVAARAYLDAAERLARDLYSASGDDLDAAAARCADAAARGGTVWLAAGPRLVFADRGAGPASTAIRPWPWVDGEGDGPSPAGRDDVVIAVGGIDPPRWTWWREIGAMSEAGLGVVWVQPGHDADRRRLPRGGLLVDTQAPFGDGCVKAPGYATRVGPLSPVATELVAACLERASAARPRRAYSSR